jgi:hypothetical protein
VCAALVTALLMPAAADARNIKVGSDLSLAPKPAGDNCIIAGPPCTNVLTSTGRHDRFPVKSPVDGHVVKFTIRSSAADTVTFRVVNTRRDTFAANGRDTGPTVTLPSAGKFSFAAHGVRIRKGDYIGFDSELHHAVATGCARSGAFASYHPVLVDGGHFFEPDANSGCGLLVQATVDPSSRAHSRGPTRATLHR